MNSQEAQEYVQKKFPFQGYMDGTIGSYNNIAQTVQKYLKIGDKILDFGSGPCDKTAVVQALGFKCSAYDDLSDDWHKLENNRDKIMQFAKESGIDFKLASGDYLPFEKNSFDMVMLHDVIEHLHDSPRDLLNDLVELIKPNGYLFITVPNAVNIRKRISVICGKTNLPPFDSYYWYPGHWRGHIREYVKDDLFQLAKFLNLEIMELCSCHLMLEVLPRMIRPIYIFLSSLFPGWKDSWLLVAQKTSDWIPKKILGKNEYAKIMGKTTRYKN
jgi:SAM-dependent methyltransferase